MSWNFCRTFESLHAERSSVTILFYAASASDKLKKIFSVFRFSLKTCVCVYSNANPLHFYALQAPRQANRWHWVWSIFESRTAWAYHITCGTSICIVYSRKLRLGWLYCMCNCLCRVIVLCGMMMKGRGEGETQCRHIACSSQKAPRGLPGLTSPTNGKSLSTEL